MEVKQKLNNLAEEARRGCGKSIWEIRGYFLPVIHRLSEKHWHLLRSQDSFESSCFQRIDEAVRKFDSQKGSFERLVLHQFRNLLKQQIFRYYARRRLTVSINDRYSNDEGDRSLELDITDGLAAVDDKFLAKEKVALLAEGDLRKLVVLRAWLQGITSDSEIALFLAEQFGGKTDSHRKYVIRFRTVCRQLLVSSNAA